MSGIEAVDWLPGLGVLAAGLVVGLVLAWRSVAAARKAQRSAAQPVPLEVRDLEGKRDALFRQIEELDDTASKRTPAQLAQERYGLELEAARALLALEEAAAATAPARPTRAAGRTAAADPSAGGDAARRPAMRGFLWGMGSTAAVLSLAFFVYVSAKPRDTGGSVTGAPGREPAAQDDSAAADEARVKAELGRHPDNLEARVALAELELERQDFMAAWNDSAKVLEKQRGQPARRGLPGDGAAGHAARGRWPSGSWRRPLPPDPDLLSARAYLAMAYARVGRMSAAAPPSPRRRAGFPSTPPRCNGCSRICRTRAPLRRWQPRHRRRTPRGRGALGNRSRCRPVSRGRRVAGVIESRPRAQGGGLALQASSSSTCAARTRTAVLRWR